MNPSQYRIAAIVPCYNEELTVAHVVAGLKQAVPDIIVYVYDNNSTDRTTEVAKGAGAVVRCESRVGKGNAIRRAFADVDADIYVMIDGDDTYDTAALPQMITTLIDGNLDHVLGVRTPGEVDAYRKGHEAGNRMFNRLVGRLFGESVTDMLSGYRVMSRRFVKSFPALSHGFEVETELTVHCVNLRVPQAEVPVGFKDRPAGSESKLRTYHDGFRILRLIGSLLQYERPVFFYSVIAAVFAIAGIALGIPVIITFIQTGLVPRLPTALLASSLMIIAVLLFMIGMLMGALLRGRQETARLAYLSHGGVR
ncbi:MAG: glycosyltransferase [Propionibacteriaceae bacterium]|nr:glycosyltransferase [Propionibacteriaceae bacterium]